MILLSLFLLLHLLFVVVSQEDRVGIIDEDLRELVYRYSFVTDIEKDDKIYAKTKGLYEEILNHLYQEETVDISYLLCDLLTSANRLTSQAVKSKLSQGTDTLYNHDIQQLAPWRVELLGHTLDTFRGTSLDVSRRICSQSLTPLEYAVMLNQPDMLHLLLFHDTADPHSIALKLAILQQSTSTVSLLLPTHPLTSLSLNHGNSAHCTNLVNHRNFTYIDYLSCQSPCDVAKLVCWLGLGCGLLQHITDAMTTNVCGSDSNRQIHHIIDSLLYDADTRSFTEPHPFWSKTPHRYTGGWLVYPLDATMDHTDCQIPHIHFDKLDRDSFRLIANLRVPLVIEGAMKGWKAFKTWAKDNLLQHYGHVDVLAGSIPYGEIFGEHFGVATIAEFLQYMEDYSKYALHHAESFEAPLYIFDGEVIDEEFNDLFVLPGSGAPFHFHCNAINALVYGRKNYMGENYGLRYHQPHLLTYIHWNAFKELVISCLFRQGGPMPPSTSMSVLEQLLNMIPRTAEVRALGNRSVTGTV